MFSDGDQVTKHSEFRNAQESHRRGFCSSEPPRRQSWLYTTPNETHGPPFPGHGPHVILPSGQSRTDALSWVPSCSMCNMLTLGPVTILYRGPNTWIWYIICSHFCNASPGAFQEYQRLTVSRRSPQAAYLAVVASLRCLRSSPTCTTAPCPTHLLLAISSGPSWLV